jgi:hypothetical protein
MRAPCENPGMPQDHAPDTTLSGQEARAVAVAFQEFAQTGLEIHRHTVIVVRHAASCEVIFVPEPEPGRSERGGRTAAGREVHYQVSLAHGALERTSYAR